MRLSIICRLAVGLELLPLSSRFGDQRRRRVSNGNIFDNLISSERFIRLSWRIRYLSQVLLEANNVGRRRKAGLLICQQLIVDFDGGLFLLSTAADSNALRCSLVLSKRTSLWGNCLPRYTVGDRRSLARIEIREGITPVKTQKSRGIESTICSAIIITS